MTSNVPAPRPPAGEPVEPVGPLPRRQRMSVAFVPLAIVVFAVLAFIAAAWTFLASVGA